MKKKLLAFVPFMIVLTISLKAQSYTYYVDPVNGNDSYSETMTQPFRTISKAVSTLSSNIGTIYLRAGTHLSPAKISLNKNGQPNNYIKIWAFPGEKPVVDFTGNGTSDGFSISGTYYHFKGLEIKKAGHNGINISGHYNIIENCLVHDNMNTGIHMGSGSSTANPSNNLILNCDSFFNFDSPFGGNADGFSAKWNVGNGNVFKGCRAYNNSDDGWDLWMCIATITIDSCMALRNGVDIWFTGQVNGNGNGFKLGGNNIAAPNTVKNCIAFDNAGNTGRGFDENNNLAGQTIYNCTSFRNKKANYWFNNNPLTIGTHNIKNCISYLPGQANSILNAVQETNSWQGFTVSDSDFLRIDTTGVTSQRDSTGKLLQSNFFRLAQSSDLVNAGTNVGIPYNGSAPDLGAYESRWGIPMVINLTAYIEGFYDGTTMLSDTLRVELISSTSPFTLIESQKMFVNNSGTGTANFSNPIESESYYLVVKHRNALETWSSTGQSFSSGTLNYNFTTVSSQAFGGNLIQKGTKWCLFSGDVNQDGVVDLNDLTSIDNDVFNSATGYRITDLNGDGVVNSNDLSLCNNNAFNFIRVYSP